MRTDESQRVHAHVRAHLSIITWLANDGGKRTRTLVLARDVLVCHLHMKPVIRVLMLFTSFDECREPEEQESAQPDPMRKWGTVTDPCDDHILPPVAPSHVMRHVEPGQHGRLPRQRAERALVGRERRRR